MSKKVKRISSLYLAIALIFSLGVGAGANSPHEVPCIMRAEYAGAELSRDKQNPTVLPFTEQEIDIKLIGNDPCKSLSSVTITPFSKNGMAGGGSTWFDENGECFYSLNDHLGMYVDNDVFDYSWGITDTSGYMGGLATSILLPGSKSTIYYITFNAGESGYRPPRGRNPRVVRAELDGAELSKDKNNPTQIPFASKLKIYGNSACKSKQLPIYPKYDGERSYSGPLAFFNSSATAPYLLFAPVESVIDNSGDLRFNEVVKIELSIANPTGAELTYSKSPKYYVVFLDDKSPT